MLDEIWIVLDHYRKLHIINIKIANTYTHTESNNTNTLTSNEQQYVEPVPLERCSCSNLGLYCQLLFVLRDLKRIVFLHVSFHIYNGFTWTNMVKKLANLCLIVYTAWGIFLNENQLWKINIKFLLQNKVVVTKYLPYIQPFFSSVPVGIANYIWQQNTQIPLKIIYRTTKKAGVLCVPKIVVL